jgi:hypothetical protein
LPHLGGVAKLREEVKPQGPEFAGISAAKASNQGTLFHLKIQLRDGFQHHILLAQKTRALKQPDTDRE